MSALCALLALTALAPPAVQVGMAQHYYSGGFKAVAANRGMPLYWDRVAGFAAVPQCAYVDARRPWAVQARLYEPATGGWSAWRWYQVVDCVQTAHLAAHRAAGLVIEVDAHTAADGGWAWDYARQVGAGRTRAVVGGYQRIGGGK